MRLEEYAPISEAIVKQTLVQKPCFPVFDIHTHMGKLLLGQDYALKYSTEEYVKYLRKCGVRMAVNLDGFYGEELIQMKEKIGGFNDFFINFMWIDFDHYDDPKFSELTKSLILESYRKGARGIKLWKDISLYKHDKHGKPIRTDDPKCSVIFNTAAELNIPVLMHIGDPTAFFKPTNAVNERYEELSQNKDWDFSDHNKYMSFNELIEMQENTIRLYPETKFIIAHVGSYAENLSWVQDQLRKYPNMNIDISARVAELGRVPYSARKMFENYSTQILFGTDTTPMNLGWHEITYRFLESEDEYFSYQPFGDAPGQGRWSIYGLGLTADVLRDVYYRNACRLLDIDVKKFEE